MNPNDSGLRSAPAPTAPPAEAQSREAHARQEGQQVQPGQQDQGGRLTNRPATTADDDLSPAPAPETNGVGRDTDGGSTVSRWYESWILRAAIAASLILFIGNVATAVIIFQSFDFIKSYVHNSEIELSLGARVDAIKDNHALRQVLIKERVEAALAASAAPGQPPVLTAATLQGFIQRAADDWVRDASQIKVTAAPGGGEPTTATAPKGQWIDRDHLRIGGWLVELPKGPTYDAFQDAQRILRLYQVGLTEVLDYFRRKFLVQTAGVLVLSYLIMAGSLVVYGRRFRAKLSEIIAGFSIWSEKDDKFRFASGYRGELKMITNQFNAMADEVAANRQRNLYLEKVASWQVIARKLAHEIKNPLTPIQMMVSQLNRRYKGQDAEFARLLADAQSIVTEEVAGLRRMVDNFSNFARLPEPQPRLTDLIPLCKHVVELQKAAYPIHTLSFSSRQLWVTGMVDEDLLRQVLINLIKNAAEACGETPARIRVNVDENESEALINIADNGPGIPPELRERIFEAYFTTKHTGPNPGMGLGLAVCQKIIIDHGGTMTVRSRPGDTVFTLRLPKRKKDFSLPQPG